VEGVLQRWVVKGVEQRPVELLNLAMNYDLPDLALACQKNVLAGLTNKNAVRIHIELDKFKVAEDDEAKDAVIHFIKKHCRR
jgi:hypothetical protein